jgi:hypothetical protein
MMVMVWIAEMPWEGILQIPLVVGVVDIGHRPELEVVEIDEKGHRFHTLVECRQEALVGLS